MQLGLSLPLFLNPALALNKFIGFLRLSLVPRPINDPRPAAWPAPSGFETQGSLFFWLLNAAHCTSRPTDNLDGPHVFVSSLDAEAEKRGREKRPPHKRATDKSVRAGQKWPPL